MLTRGSEILIEQSLLYPGGFISPLEIEDAVTRALAEDLGRAGDVTSIATIPAGTPSRTVLVARQPGTISGLPLVAACFRKLAPDIEIRPQARDGDNVAAKTVLMQINGDARAVLSAERVSLNFLQHLSGIATATAAFVQRAGGGKTRICCTRKTTPGLRALEKYAVRCGGGFNHRFGLDDAILIKDNHVAVAGGIRAVLERARAAAGHLVKIEIEVDSLNQLQEVLDCGLADVVLIDNFDVASMKTGGGDGRRPAGDRSLRRHHARYDRGDCRDRRRLCLVRRADTFGAGAGCGSRHRDLDSVIPGAPTSRVDARRRRAMARTRNPYRSIQAAGVMDSGSRASLAGMTENS